MSVHVSILRHRWFLTISLVLVVGLLPVFVFGKPASGDPKLPTGFEQFPVANGLTRPTAMEFAPDGRLFVAEKGGRLRVIDENDENNSGLQTEPFVDISDQVSSRGERGLLGIAFHPDFGNNPYVYVYYTRKASDGTPAHNRVVRFKANGNAAVEGSEELVFKLDNLRKRGQGSDNHNGGAIHFGTDDKLYVAAGDNKRDRTAQSMNTVLGKMLRINADGSIPTDNPFYTNPEDKNDAIWAKGLRNPYTFAVQPVTGKLHINDVGEQRWEEINVGKAGANYGWPRYEGPRPEQDGRFTRPIFYYRHGSGPNTGCAITGGTFYNPPQGASSSFPEDYLGDYFFADFCSGWIRVLDTGDEEVSPFATGINFPVDLKVNQDGSLYYLSLAGSVHKVQPSA